MGRKESGAEDIKVDMTMEGDEVIGKEMIVMEIDLPVKETGVGVQTEGTKMEIP
jgi:hypothetical protein